MASVLVNPPITEQLPPYTSDPETSSVSSRAPSYVSAAPAYDQLIFPPTTLCPRGERDVAGSGNGVCTSSSATANSTTATSATSNLADQSGGSATINTSAIPSASASQSSRSTLLHPSGPCRFPPQHGEVTSARTGGLPNHPFAEGFVPRLPGSIPSYPCFDGKIFSSRRPGDVRGLRDGSSCSNDWPSTRNSHAAKQYHAVARRRARSARDGAEQVNGGSLNKSGSSTCTNSGSTGISGCADAVMGPTKGLPGCGAGGSSASAMSGSATAMADEGVVNPLEDPYLVGEEAARKARETRIYRETCAREAEAIKGEGKVGGIVLF